MSSEIACHGCDLLLDVAGLQDRQVASCPRCGGFLTRYRADAFSRTLAYTTAAIILLVLANLYPFLSFSASGLANEMKLLQTPSVLWEYGMPGASLIVGAFILVIPAAVLLMLLTLCIAIGRDRYAPYLNTLARGIFIGQNWAMVEVFIIGVIVSLVKIAAMATVSLGLSFWAYVAFSICFTLAISSLDRYQCWQRLEHMAKEQVIGQQVPTQ